MGVYIKMNMPDPGLYLLDVSLRHNVDNDSIGKVIFTVSEQTNSGKIIPRFVGEAIAVSPHGDLVDVDALEVVAYENTAGFEDTFDDGVKYALELMDQAKTVIPADRGEDE